MKEQVQEEETKEDEEDGAEEIPGGKTLEEVSEDVPQDIKNKIIDLEAEQQEKLRATMLRNTFQPKTSALKNLEDMFEEYPVVTNESLKLKMETLGQIQLESEESVNGLDAKQQVFSRLLTSINPFSQFILQELINSADEAEREKVSEKTWELDEKILQRRPGDIIPKEHLLKTSAEMFSIYLYTKDPTMMIKSEKYTQGEFKAVKDLVNLDESLLVSSQMANSLLLLNQHEKMVNDAKQAINNKTAGESSGAKAPEPASSEESGSKEKVDENRDAASEAV